MDEPVSALDPDGARSLYALVHKIYRQQQMTVVVVEHDLNYLLPYLTDLVLISGGEAVVQGRFEEAAQAGSRVAGEAGPGKTVPDQTGRLAQ